MKTSAIDVMTHELETEDLRRRKGPRGGGGKGGKGRGRGATDGGGCCAVS